MKKQTILGILGTLILGALGSGLWEAIKPGVSFLGSSALTIISLGIDSVANDIYTRVGRANLPVVWIKGTTLLTLSIGLAIGSGVALSRAIKNPDSMALTRGIRLALFLCLLASYCVFGSFRHTYVADKRGYFDYLARASAPYLSSEQRLVIDSRLALVKSKADYDKLISELKGVLAANRVPISSE